MQPDQTHRDADSREAEPGVGTAHGWARRRTPLAHWIIAGSLAVIALCLVLRLDERYANPAFGQAVSYAGARGVFAFTGQLSKTSYGVFMVDLDTATLWCYEISPTSKALNLVASRTWQFDRYVKNMNTRPAPDEIKQELEKQRDQELQSLPDPAAPEPPTAGATPDDEPEE